MTGSSFERISVRKYARQYPVPTYVVEFLLGRYCASVDENEINEGLTIVEKQLKDRTVRTGDEELVKSRAKHDGSVKVIDIVRARLDAKNDRYLAELPSLALKDVRVDERLVNENERMLTDGFYAEVTLGYDGAIALEKNGLPFSIEALRPIQMSKSDVLEVFSLARRKAFSHRRTGSTSSSARSGWSRRLSTTARSRSCCCAWSRSSNATTTSSNSVPEGPAKATSSNRCRHTRT